MAFAYLTAATSKLQDHVCKSICNAYVYVYVYAMYDPSALQCLKLISESGNPFIVGLGLARCRLADLWRLWMHGWWDAYALGYQSGH